MESESKPTNPKDAIGIRKQPMSFVPPNVLQELGLAMMEGALKYGPYNWRSAGVRYSVYYDAAQRHLMQWWEGEDKDPDSGLSHLIKAMACMVVLRDSIKAGNAVDDRPPQTIAPEDHQHYMNLAAGKLIDKYGNKNA